MAAALQGGVRDEASPYDVKTVSNVPTVRSIGGITVLPDYNMDNYPSDYAGIVLVGGMSWRNAEAQQVAPLVLRAYEDGKAVGAICDATTFLARHGLLNTKKHTGNTVDNLREVGKGAYTGEALYQHVQAVRDGNLVTANGTAYLEFTCELLAALNAFSDQEIQDYYRYYREGYIALMQSFKS